MAAKEAHRDHYARDRYSQPEAAVGRSARDAGGPPRAQAGLRTRPTSTCKNGIRVRVKINSLEMFPHSLEIVTAYLYELVRLSP